MNAIDHSMPEANFGMRLMIDMRNKVYVNKNQKAKLIKISANPSSKKNCKAPDVCHPSPTKAKGNPQ